MQNKKFLNMLLQFHFFIIEIYPTKEGWYFLFDQKLKPTKELENILETSKILFQNQWARYFIEKNLKRIFRDKSLLKTFETKVVNIC